MNINLAGVCSLETDSLKSKTRVIIGESAANEIAVCALVPPTKKLKRILIYFDREIQTKNIIYM